MTLADLRAQIALGEDSRRQFKQDVTNADSLDAEMARLRHQASAGELA